MSSVDDRLVAQRARRVRYRLEIDRLDRDRLAVELARHGAAQPDIGRLLGLTQPGVSKLLGRTADLPKLVEGFSGATPLEICKRYAAGDLTRGQLIDELVRFPYAPRDRDPFDDYSPDPPGAWSEVEDAEGLGLIDEDIYEEIFSRRHPVPEGP